MCLRAPAGLGQGPSVSLTPSGCALVVLGLLSSLGLLVGEGVSPVSPWVYVRLRGSPSASLCFTGPLCVDVCARQGPCVSTGPPASLLCGRLLVFM